MPNHKSIGNTFDPYNRALDSQTGKEAWKARPPASGKRYAGDLQRGWQAYISYYCRWPP
jgi:glucose dehydrogenase